MTITQAAGALGVSRPWVWALYDAGRLTGTRTVDGAGRTLIDLDATSVEAYKVNRLKPGRPVKNPAQK